MLYVNYCELRQIPRFDKESHGMEREEQPSSTASVHSQAWKSTNTLNLDILKLV